MITAQDIREKTFDKAKFGGYDMASVDDFLEDLAEEVTASQKENAVLKSKMKILVDKIEEYRANEEALNMAVLSAQKLAVQIESEARARANAMLAEADRQVNAKIGSIAEQADAEENRLAAAKSATRPLPPKPPPRLPPRPPRAPPPRPPRPPLPLPRSRTPSAASSARSPASSPKRASTSTSPRRSTCLPSRKAVLTAPSLSLSDPRSTHLRGGRNAARAPLPLF